MKLKSLLFALCAILVAVSASFATKAENNITPIDVWFLADESEPPSAENCLRAVLEVAPCNLTPNVPCVKTGVVDADSSTPYGTRIIFTDESCLTAYQEEIP